MFLNNEHKNCQDFLLPFIACSSGLTKNDLSKICDGKDFNTNLEHLLISRSLLRTKLVEYNNEKIQVFYMDTPIWTVIETRNNKQDVDAICQKVLQMLSKLLLEALEHHLIDGKDKIT